jgi:prophage antirepressor-like protein
MTNTTLTFQSTTFDVIDRNGQPWLRSPQIADALGYGDGSSINRIYARHTNEFTDAMTASVKLTDPNSGEQETRIFSPRGCHALGMFARTKVAKAFRVWVLDVLEGKAAIPARPALTHNR